MRLIIAAVLFCSSLACAKKPPALEATTPEIGVAFSKAAIKALLTIHLDSGEQLINAATVDLEVETTTGAEMLIAFDIALLEFDRQQRKELIELGMDLAENTADNESKCVNAWVPQLRALSA